MRTLQHTLLFFLIILVEGYVVLSTELIFIRQTVPFVGSGTDTISIVIAAVLMPLAFGYQQGGRFKPHKLFGYFISTRRKLIINILISSTILLIGMNYHFLHIFFVDIMGYFEIKNRLIQLSWYCTAFLVIPVYLLGQTVPLISNYFSKEKLSKITGRILFVSTVGSFLGAVFSTIVIMSILGVHHTVTLNFVLLACLVILLSKKKSSKAVMYSIALAFLALLLNSDEEMARYRVVSNNQYNLVQVIPNKGDRHLFINRNASSKYNDARDKHIYVKFAERIVLLPIQDKTQPPKDILVIGAGGFTFGHEDKHNNYVFVDIDKELKRIAEDYILKEPLGENKEFVAMPARGYLHETDRKFDVIYLDAYRGGSTIPEQLITREFFMKLKNRLNHDGVLICNMILAANFKNQYTRNVDNTFRSVFPHYSRHIIPPFDPEAPPERLKDNPDMYFLWSNKGTELSNVTYIYKHEDDYDIGDIYTDNKNTSFLHKAQE